MNLYKLADYFREQVTAEEITKLIDSEVDEFRLSAAKTGSSAAVYADHDDFKFAIELKHVKIICASYLSGSFGDWHIYYLCNLIELSESFDFADEEAEEAIFVMSDPTINYPIMPKLVKLIYIWIERAKEISLADYLQQNYL